MLSARGCGLGALTLSFEPASRDLGLDLLIPAIASFSLALRLNAIDLLLQIALLALEGKPLLLSSLLGLLGLGAQLFLPQLNLLSLLRYALLPL